MNFLRDFGILCKISVPTVTTVRYAARRIKKNKFTYDLTDMAKWRKQRGLTINPNKFGQLTNLPDYSFVDGRPVPLGINLKTRLERQKEYAETINRLSAEVDFARNLYQGKQKEELSRRQFLIGNKLKRKGKQLLNEDQSSKQ